MKATLTGTLEDLRTMLFDDADSYESQAGHAELKRDMHKHLARAGEARRIAQFLDCVVILPSLTGHEKDVLSRLLGSTLRAFEPEAAVLRAKLGLPKIDDDKEKPNA